MKSKNLSDWHHYALDKSGSLVHIEKGNEIAREDYYCIGCGKEVRPVMGKDREWHFRHKVINPDCDHESWLHKFAKRYFLKKFESEEQFIVSYWVKDICSQFGNCELKSDKCCSERLYTIDLKQVYDVCEEEKTNGSDLYRADLKFYNSKDTNIKPIFLEIAYTHDCKPEKIASGIQIIEIKIEKEEDLEQSLVESRQLMFDYQSGNPYSFCSLPSIRFYNFERMHKKSMSNEIQIFMIAKDKQRLIHGVLGVEKTIGCDKVDYINHPSFMYLLCVSSEYMKKNPQFNLWCFGLLKAALHGFNIRNCMLCKNCHEGRGGCVRYGNFMVNLLGSKEINKDDEAIHCNSFIPLTILEIKKFFSVYKKIPYIEKLLGTTNNN